MIFLSPSVAQKRRPKPTTWRETGCHLTGLKPGSATVCCTLDDLDQFEFRTWLHDLARRTTEIRIDLTVGGP